MDVGKAERRVKVGRKVGGGEGKHDGLNVYKESSHRDKKW